MYAARIQMILGFAEREHHPSGFGFVDWSNVEVKNDQGDGFKLRERVCLSWSVETKGVRLRMMLLNSRIFGKRPSSQRIWIRALVKR